jgi:hypothetical protein
MPYRAELQETFSSDYAFKGSPPADDAGWLTLLNTVVAVERPIYLPSVSWLSAMGYDSDDPHATHVFSYAFDAPVPAGTMDPPAPTVAAPMAGDQAALVSWPTDAKSAKGKRIYLRKYIHHGYVQLAEPDRIDGTTYKPVLLTYATAVDGIHGGLRSPNRDLNVTDHNVSDWVTTRTLKHRGKKGGPNSRAGGA